MSVTCSADLAPVFGEYERFSAAILNAAIAPIVGSYLQRLQRGIGAGRLRLMRSSLGILPAAEATTFPARAMFSGPAGGVLAAAQLARRIGAPAVAAFDMGGTSADVCLVDGCGENADGSIAGLPLPLPAVPVHTVGCGGGSLAYVDAGGALRVGPESAGADPGPACHGKGVEPTVTDAHVVLGHLGPHTLLAGAFPVDVDAGVRAVERLARRLSLGIEATARGIVDVADATMARAILVITAERAVDPATVPLVAYGGAGGLHAAGLLARLGMPSALLPPHAGAFSALGLALAGESVERSVAVRERLERAAMTRLVRIGRELLQEARAAIDGPARARVEVLARYAGQGATLRLPLRPGLARAFMREHHRRYGFEPEAPIEVVRVTARVDTAPHRFPATAQLAARARIPTSTRRRPIGGEVRIAHRDDRGAGRYHGPIVIEEATATTLVPAGYTALATPFGLRVQRVAHRRSTQAFG